MSVKKFLDLSGVSRLWTNIGNTFAKKIDLVGKNVVGTEYEIDEETVTAETATEIFNDYRNRGTTTDEKYQMELKSGNICVGEYSHCEGMGNDVLGKYSHAEGLNTTSNGGYGSHSQGLKTQANGEGSHAEGEECIANGSDSHAEGLGSQANSLASHSEGGGCVTDALFSHAEGEGSYTYGASSHVEGKHTIASCTGQHVEGQYNIEDEGGDYAHIIGNGYYDEEGEEEVRSNAHTVDWDGNAWYKGTVKVGGTDYSDADELATKSYIDTLVSEGATKTFLYNGKANGTAILTDTTEDLGESIYDYDMIVVGFNAQIATNLRAMELTQVIYPHTDTITYCDATGAGATGAYQVMNSNSNFTSSGNAYRVMWGFTDATHIRNILGTPVNSWINPGIAYVVGYKFHAVVIPSGGGSEPNIIRLTSVPEDFLYARGSYSSVDTLTITDTDDLASITNSAQAELNGQEVTFVSFPANLNIPGYTAKSYNTFPVTSNMVATDSNDDLVAFTIDFFKEAFNLNGSTWQVGYDFQIAYQMGACQITRSRRGN